MTAARRATPSHGGGWELIASQKCSHLVARPVGQWRRLVFDLTLGTNVRSTGQVEPLGGPVGQARFVLFAKVSLRQTGGNEAGYDVRRSRQSSASWGDAVIPAFGCRPPGHPKSLGGGGHLPHHRGPPGCQGGHLADKQPGRRASGSGWFLI
jgi:hypothetical protein